MNRFGINVELKHTPALDPEFIPLMRFNRAFLATAKKPVGIAVERADGQMASCRTFIHGTPEMAEADHYYIERLVKTILWMKGGFKVYVSGDEGICEYLKSVYCAGGQQAFDWDYMANVFEHPFEIVLVDDIPAAKDDPKAIGGHMEGCRIGFDAGGSDRKVSAVIDGESVLQADERSLKKLAENFYNDTYLMDQNACSSPQLVLWLNGGSEARERFWDAVAEYAGNLYELQGMTAVDKYTQLCEDAVERPEVEKVLRQNGNLLYRAELSGLPENAGDDLRGRGGYFYEADLSELSDICPVVNEKYQTLTYFGLGPERLRKMVIDDHLRGIDRIVPVGRAMDIGVIWDGYDIIGTLSRIVQAG